METVLPGVIVDGAHNEDGVEKFVETAEHFQKECPLTLLFSAVDDKDYTRYDTYDLQQDHVPSCGSDFCGRIPPGSCREILQSLFTERRLLTSVEASGGCWRKPLRRALEAKAGMTDMLFCVGSLYLVGEIKDVIRRNKK